MEPDGFGWYVILPEGENGACLGLLDKYNSGEWSGV